MTDTTKGSYIKLIGAKFTDKDIKGLGYDTRKKFDKKLKQWKKWQLCDLLNLLNFSENGKEKPKETRPDN